jgi:hypothetical protein
MGDLRSVCISRYEHGATHCFCLIEGDVGKEFFFVSKTMKGPISLPLQVNASYMIVLLLLPDVSIEYEPITERTDELCVDAANIACQLFPFSHFRRLKCEPEGSDDSRDVDVGG